LSLITTIRQKKTKNGIGNQFLPSSCQERSESGGKWFLNLLGKGERDKGKGVRESVRQGGDDWTKSRLWSQGECETGMKTKSQVGWGWSGGNWEKKEMQSTESKLFAFLILHSVTFWLNRENVTCLTFFVISVFYAILTRFYAILLIFLFLSLFLHIWWGLTHKIVRFYELKRIFNNHASSLIAFLHQYPV
jgi:hypothetical protein